MKAILRPLMLAAACAVAFPSMAADRCEHSRSETPALDVADKRTLENADARGVGGRVVVGG